MKKISGGVEPKPRKELTFEEEYENLKSTPKGRYKLLSDSRFFKKRIFELCNEEEKKMIENLKEKLNWEDLPYNNLEELIKWINHPQNVSKESMQLLKLIGEKAYNELSDIERLSKDYLTHLDRERLKHIFQI